MFSHQADYAPDGKMIPISTKDGNAWQQVDSIVMDYYQGLFQGYLVREVYCLEYNTIKPPMLLTYTNHLEEKMEKTAIYYIKQWWSQMAC